MDDVVSFFFGETAMVDGNLGLGDDFGETEFLAEGLDGFFVLGFAELMELDEELGVDLVEIDLEVRITDLVLFHEGHHFFFEALGKDVVDHLAGRKKA